MAMTNKPTTKPGVVGPAKQVKGFKLFPLSWNKPHSYCPSLIFLTLISSISNSPILQAHAARLLPSILDLNLTNSEQRLARFFK